MKVSKSLLKTIMVGLTVTAIGTSCELVRDTAEVKPEDNQHQNCQEGCDIDHSKEVYHEDNCPACGLG